MDVQAWCGLCGQSFRLAQLIDGGFEGRCPRCGEDLAGSYGPVISAAVIDLIAASQRLRDAAGRLRASAAHLHVDGRQLAADIVAAVDGGERR